jgi:hypothetical protein
MSIPSSERPKGSTGNEMGPWGWENWQAKLSGRQAHSAFEVACYTDGDLLGEPQHVGPYVLLGNRSEPFEAPRGPVRLGLVLRVENHLHIADPEDFIDEAWEQLDPEVYHGDHGGQELASLIALALGVRLKAGGIVRVFDPAGDPRGRPREYKHVMPYLPSPGWAPILPALAPSEGVFRYRVAIADAIPLLNRYPGLSAVQAVALVRAARSYQEAMWVAENDPRQSWLRLVNAVEAAAQRWNPHEGPRARFVGFVMAFRPKPPRPRPPSGERVDWRHMDKHLKAIYGHRNRDFHAGIPFPPPLCEPPIPTGRRAPREIPFTPRVFGRRPRWKSNELPMLLHSFEYIVRRALQAWWDAGTPTVPRP